MTDQLTTAQARAELRKIVDYATHTNPLAPIVGTGGRSFYVIATPRSKGHVAADLGPAWDDGTSPTERLRWSAPRFGGWVAACGRIMLGEIHTFGWYDSDDLQWYSGTGHSIDDLDGNGRERICPKCTTIVDGAAA